MVKLQSAAIRTDESLLHRTARFTDGSTGVVEMKWDDVRRVAAFRRDVMTQPMICVAITDASKVVVLDESMEGFPHLVEALAGRLAGAPVAEEWRDSMNRPDQDVNFTFVYQRQAE
jgi:hypothetical protein